MSGSPTPSRGAGRLVASFRHAYDGLLHAMSQPNMKVHLVAAALVGLVGSGIPLGLAEKVTLVFCVMLVFFAEILNTALEALVDLHTEDIRDLARITKDTAAAGVLVLSLGTVLLFATILVYNAQVIARHGDAIARQTAFGIPLVVAIASLLREGTRSARRDHATFAVGLLFVVVLLPTTESHVFSAITALLLVLAWRWSRAQRTR